ncbi:MAG: hypothetical protein HN719_12490, partial [Alphaproteobacteria bacterium]|nr:hypothetical protein [Alphaproteobacteria bacterium]
PGAVEAGEQAFAQALAGGASLDDAMTAAANASTTSGLQSVLAQNPLAFGSNQSSASIMNAVVGEVVSKVVGTLGDPTSAGTGSGPNYDQDAKNQNKSAIQIAIETKIDESTENLAELAAEADQIEGDLEHLEDGIEDFFDAFFEDPFLNFEEAFFFEETFGFGDDIFFEEDVFSLEPVFDFLEDDLEFTSEPVVEQTLFDEILKGSTGSDTLSGSAGNTNYYFSYADIGGTDTISDGGGINQIAFDSLDNTVIKFTIDNTVATTGNVEIWGGSGNNGYSSVSGSDGTYTLTNAKYSGATNSTISFTDVSQYLFADTATAALSDGFSTHSEEDLSATQSDADTGDVLVMPALQAGDVGYVIAGGSGADVFDIDDAAMDGAIVFGKGGGDTFNVKTSLDALLIGGITATDNNDNAGSDGIPDANINLFSFSTMFTGATGLSGNILGFYDSFFDVYETTAVMNNASGNGLNTILWDVGSFTGSAGNDTISLSGQTALNTFDGGAGNDSITVSGNVRILTINGGAGDDTLSTAIGALTSKTVILDGGTGTADTLSLTGGGTLTAAEMISFTKWETWSMGSAGTYNLTLHDNNAGTGALTVNAAAATVLTFDGSAETVGTFTVTGSSGADTITGGAKGDTLIGGTGGDTYVSRALGGDNSQITTPGDIDSIVFNTAEGDVIDVSNTGINEASIGTPTVTTGDTAAKSLVNLADITGAGKLTLASVGDISVFTISGTGAGTYLVIEGTGGTLNQFDAGNDYIVKIAGASTVGTIGDANILGVGFTSTISPSTTMTLTVDPGAAIVVTLTALDYAAAFVGGSVPVTQSGTFTQNTITTLDASAITSAVTVTTVASSTSSVTTGSGATTIKGSATSVAVTATSIGNGTTLTLEGSQNYTVTGLIG